VAAGLEHIIPRRHLGRHEGKVFSRVTTTQRHYYEFCWCNLVGTGWVQKPSQTKCQKRKWAILPFKGFIKRFLDGEDF
jgi:hypothetical protein